MSFLSLLVVTAGKKNTKVLILLYTYKNTKEYPLTLFLLKNVSFGKNSKTFGDKEELFQWGRSAIDRHLQFQKEETERKAVVKAEYYIKKGKEAALKAFSSAMYFSNIEGKEYEEALGFFQYELDKQFGKLK